MQWLSNPLSLIEYQDFTPAELIDRMPRVTTIESIDDIFMFLFRTDEDPVNSRLRIKNLSTGKIDKIPVFFYNESDRIKSYKNYPFIIIHPFEPHPVEDHIKTDTDKIPHPSTNEKVYLNENARWHEFAYRVTAVDINFKIYRRLTAFLSEALFPLIHGQRRIMLSVTSANSKYIYNYRAIEVGEYFKTEDFENNNFQFSLTFTFRVPLYVNAWIERPTVRVVEIEFEEQGDIVEYEID